MQTPRDGIAAIINARYMTVGDDAISAAAEVGLASYDALLNALCGLVGGKGVEGDLFDAKAHAAARAAVSQALALK